MRVKNPDVACYMSRQTKICADLFWGNYWNRDGKETSFCLTGKINSIFSWFHVFFVHTQCIELRCHNLTKTHQLQWNIVQKCDKNLPSLLYWLMEQIKFMLMHWPVRLQYDCHIGRAIKCWVQMLTLAMKRNDCTNIQWEQQQWATMKL